MCNLNYSYSKVYIAVYIYYHKCFNVIIMKRKIMLGIFIIAIICISSGAYAVLSENATVSSDDATNIADNDIQINTDNSKVIPVQDDSFNPQIAQSGVIKEEAKDLVYIGKYAHYNVEDGLADRYIICVECGGFVAIGEVTNPLPDAALCHHFMGYLGSGYKEGSYSHDDAYNLWEISGYKVYDDGSKVHEDNIINEEIIKQCTNPDDEVPLVDLTPCDDSITS